MGALVLGFSIRAWVLSALVALVLGSGVAGFYAYREHERQLGVAQGRVRQLDSLLVEQKVVVAKTDTVRVVTEKRFTERVIQWKTDSAKVIILSEPDSNVVPVAAYRTLSANADSTISAGLEALASSNAELRETRKFLLLTITKDSIQIARKMIAPPTHKWRSRAEHVLVVGLLSTVIYQQVHRQ